MHENVLSAEAKQSADSLEQREASVGAQNKARALCTHDTET